MKVVRVVGGATERTAAVERLVEYLSDRGRVGTVSAVEEGPLADRETADSGEHTASEPDRSFTLGPDGTWTVTGQDGNLTGALDRLAPDCDYVVVEGFEDVQLPTVVLGDGQPSGETTLAGAPGVDEPLASAPSAASLDLDAVAAALADVDDYETLESLVESVKASADAERGGAIATFTGRVRARDHLDDEPTEYLEFERYDGVATERMAAIRADLEARDGVHEVALHHRTGVVGAGEDIVFVVVLAGHRKEAFPAVEDGIDRLKEEVPLFKKEVTLDGEYWAHEPDHASGPRS